MFKGYLDPGDKDFTRYIQHQNNKHNNGEKIDKDKFMKLALNKYKHIFTKDKWLAKSPEEQHFVELSKELEKMKGTSIKLASILKAKVTPKGITIKTPQNRRSTKSMIGRNHPLQKAERIKKMRKTTYNWCMWSNSWVEHDS